MAILQNTTVSGSLVITGDLTARQFILSSSVTFYTESFSSGSTRFGDSMDDTMKVTGSLLLTGSMFINTVTAQNAASNRGNMTINGATSILNLATGDTNAGYLYHGGTDLLLVNAKNGAMQFYTNDTERMRITSAGNVGIGTTNPSSILDVRAGVGTTGTILSLQNTTGGAAGNIVPIRFYAGNTFGGLEQIAAIWGINPNAGTNNGGALVFATSTNGTGTTPTERMRLNTTGLGIGVSPSYKLHVNADSCGGFIAEMQNTNLSDCAPASVLNLIGGTYSGNDTTSKYLSFRRGDGTEIGAVRRNGATNVAFDTSSDYRLKEDLKDFNGLDKLSRIKVYDFQWKDTTNRMDGVLAHELQEVVPYAVGGVKDEMTEEGKPQYQGVDYSKLVPTLIKAVQELKAENDSLKEILTRNNIS